MRRCSSPRPRTPRSTLLRTGTPDSRYAPFTARAIAIIRSIPRGKVAAYGQVAGVAGSPLASRQVVRVLHTLSRTELLPWHRVINSAGSISLPRGGGFERLEGGDQVCQIRPVGSDGHAVKNHPCLPSGSGAASRYSSRMAGPPPSPRKREAPGAMIVGRARRYKRCERAGARSKGARKAAWRIPRRSEAVKGPEMRGRGGSGKGRSGPGAGQRSSGTDPGDGARVKGRYGSSDGRGRKAFWFFRPPSFRGHGCRPSLDFEKILALRSQITGSP
jgi:alkylated DNA nucleotide flippase Atl1